jgi:hypothetical protein
VVAFPSVELDMIKTAGKQFNPAERNLYFIAAGPVFLEEAVKVNKHMLCAVNELRSEQSIETCKRIMAAGVKLFIDSGVYALTNEHARANNCSMDMALGLAPDKIDGFQELYDRYVEVCSSIGEEAWGYIEIDQGGRANKIKTRAKLEKLGLRPVPVYHPINDGWDYFDYLAQRYDRICFGNIVQAEIAERVRLISTAFIRRQKYPHLWIHMLGITPNEILFSCPSHSCDSSDWLSGVRWGNVKETACGNAFGDFTESMVYPYHKREFYFKLLRLLAYQAETLNRNWRRHTADLASL